MHLTIRNAVWLSLLISAAAATWYLSRPEPEEAPRNTGARASSLGYYLIDAVLLGTDETGEVLYRIVAERVEEHPGSAQLRLTSIEIEYRDEADVPWRIRASFASGPTSRDYLDLSGDVRIESLPNSEGQRTIIEADSLRLEPEARFASTDGPVRFLVDDVWLYGVGLKAYLKDDRIDLESQVNARIRQ
jgi:lipopolysaccharide export system protein LptC